MREAGRALRATGPFLVRRPTYSVKNRNTNQSRAAAFPGMLGLNGGGGVGGGGWMELGKATIKRKSSLTKRRQFVKESTVTARPGGSREIQQFAIY